MLFTFKGGIGGDEQGSRFGRLIIVHALVLGLALELGLAWLLWFFVESNGAEISFAFEIWDLGEYLLVMVSLRGNLEEIEAKEWL